MRIDRCVCADMTFESLKQLAQKNNWPLDVLMDKTTAGQNCGLCRPYLARCMRTGQTVFLQVIRDCDEPVK